MKIDRISYSKVFPLGAYVNERIGAEMTLEEGDNASKGLEELRQFVHEFHQKNFTPFQEETIPEIKVEEPQFKSQVERYEYLISNATSLTELESYKLLSSNYPQLKEAYNKKLTELSINTNNQ